MSDLIKIKGGSGNVPTLQDRELGYSKTEKALYIGTSNGNVKLCDANKIDGMFYATYGVTTGAEIDAAMQLGKGIACKITSGDYNGRILQLVTNLMTGDSFTFSCLDYPVVISASVDGSTWSQIVTYTL